MPRNIIDICTVYIVSKIYVFMVCSYGVAYWYYFSFPLEFLFRRAFVDFFLEDWSTTFSNIHLQYVSKSNLSYRQISPDKYLARTNSLLENLKDVLINWQYMSFSKKILYILNTICVCGILILPPTHITLLQYGCI
jgi:hypothetical protein